MARFCFFRAPIQSLLFFGGGGGGEGGGGGGEDNSKSVDSYDLFS